jgi:hypothetical protein
MIAALIPALLPLLKDLFERTIPDPAERDKQMQALLAQLMQADTGQMEVNKAEAESGSIFVAGWRPAIGWVCALALLYSYILVPLAMWVGFVIGKPIPKPPTLDEHLWELMGVMLGMGGLRSWERVKIAGK